MTTEEKTTKEQEEKTPAKDTAAGKKPPRDSSAPKERTTQRRNTRPPRARRGFRRERERSEFDQKPIDVRRVARVVSGGRRFSFRVTVVVGDRNGRVGVGMGKGNDTASAIEKAARDGKKNMITIPRTESGSIPHQVDVKYKTVQLMVTPSPGKGIIAGSAARTVLELAGIKDVNLKIFSPTKNKLNIARATAYALSQLRTPRKAKTKQA